MRSEERGRKRKCLVFSGIAEYNARCVDERSAKDSAFVAELAYELGMTDFVLAQGPSAKDRTTEW